jgi:hypothetical protein
MHTSATLVFRFALAAAALGSGFLSGCAGYHPAEYTGDGTMYALPQGAPRYDLELEPLSLMRSGHAEFQLATLPADNLLAVIAVSDPTPEKLAAIEHAGVQVSMKLVDQDAGRASTKQGYLLADWSPTLESWNLITADYQGIWFHPTRHSRYTLTIDVEIDHPIATPPVVNATPHVRGGGFGTH